MKNSLRIWAVGCGVALVTALAVLPTSSASAVTNTAPRPSSTACGAKIYKSTGRAWVCTFADDFNGTALDTRKWTAQQTALSGVHAGIECLLNSRNNVSVSSGSLKVTVRKEAKPFVCQNPNGNYTTQYTSGGVTTSGKFGQTYGRFEFRAKISSAQVGGLQTSLWLYPNKMTYGVWPASGEIDVAETYSNYPDRAIPYIHYLHTLGADPVTNTQCKIANMSSYHTYVAEWTSTGLTISYDGVTCLTHRWSALLPLFGSKPFDQPFSMIISQVLGNQYSTNFFNPDTTPLPATTTVDWVRAWS